MAEEAFVIKVKSTKQEAQVEISVQSSASVKDMKDLVAASSLAVPAESQRLIYQGKVLKDADPISTYNIKEGSCILLSTVAGTAPVSAAPISAPSATAAMPITSPPPSTGSAAPAPGSAPPSVAPVAPGQPVPAHLVVLRAAINGIRTNGNTPEVAGTALRTLLTIVTNITGNPHEAKYRSLKKANATFQKKAGGVPGVPACLRAIGFAENDDTWELVPNEAAWNVLLSAKTELEAVVATLAPPAPAPGVPMMPGMGGGPGMMGGMMPPPMPGMPGGMDPQTMARTMQGMMQNPAMMQQAIQQMRTMNPAMAQQAEALLSNPAAMQQAAQMLQNPQAMQQAMAMMQQGQGAGLGSAPPPMPQYPNFMPPQYAPQAGQQPPQPAQQQAEQTEDEMIAEAIRRSLQDM